MPGRQRVRLHELAFDGDDAHTVVVQEPGEVAERGGDRRLRGRKFGRVFGQQKRGRHLGDEFWQATLGERFDFGGCGRGTGREALLSDAVGDEAEKLLGLGEGLPKSGLEVARVA